jgi:Mg2+ and Co2+ transporter CorA
MPSPAPDGAFVAFGAVLGEPGLIWACRAEAGVMRIRPELHPEPRAGDHDEDEDAAEGKAGFEWLHLNLADQRTHAWLLRERLFPDDIAELLLVREQHPRAMVEADAVGFVFQDFARDFDGESDGLSSIHVALRPGLMITGRYHPVQCADLIRRRLDRAPAAFDDAGALALVLDVASTAFSSKARELYVGVQTADDQFHSGDTAAAAQAMSGVRRQAARLHRVTGGLNAVLQRLEDDPDLPDAIAATVARYVQRLASINADITAIQGQTRALREEFDLLATQKTNSNLYFLSLMSALLLPATLVTGFFGMNTANLPLSHGPIGTAGAAVAAGISSLATWLLLRARA